MKEYYLKELERAFKDFKFFTEDHHYEYKGERVGMSVTRFIEEYCNEFNAEEIAEKVATKENKTVQEVLDEWSYKNKFACEKGSTCHEFAQSLWSGEKWELREFDKSNEYLAAVESIKRQAKDFYNDYNNRLEHLADEFVVGSDEYDIASAIDHLFVDKKTGKLILADYKTNTNLKGHKDGEDKKWYTKNMKVPLHNLKDLTIYHYYIQLSIYRFLIEKYTTLQVSQMVIIWFSEKKCEYEIIKIPYLKNEVEKILESRRIKNMNSVPVLLIGASGTGKSTSLRNFKGDEIAVVNVLGKPLPFKSDIKAAKCDDYATILKAIQNTNKKIIVIDDANYLITNEFMNKASIKGYDKYSDMANNFWNLINGIKNIEGGKTVYLIMHEDTDENGNIKPKTIGRMLDEKVNIQGIFTICIRSMFKNGDYIFRLKTNGQDCVKTPFDMFQVTEMDNDLKEFDKVVREYYELDKVEEKEGK